MFLYLMRDVFAKFSSNTTTTGIRLVTIMFLHYAKFWETKQTKIEHYVLQKCEMSFGKKQENMLVNKVPI
jgi:hypothetical protein